MKRKIKEQANLIQLTFSALNKSGLVFASFLIGGLIFAGVSFWRTLQEDRPIPYSNIVEDVEPPHPLGSLATAKTLTESSYDIYKDITFKENRYSVIFDMLFLKYSSDCGIGKKTGFERDFGKRLKALSSKELEYLLESDLRAFQVIRRVKYKEASMKKKQDRKLKKLRESGRSEDEIKRIVKRDPLEYLKPNTSLEEIRKDLELNEYHEDYNYLSKKDFYFEHGFNPK